MLSAIGEEGIPHHINKHMMKRHTKAFITPRDSFLRPDLTNQLGKNRVTLHGQIKA